MPASYQLIFRIQFGHTFFADGILRSLRIVPVPACHDMLRRAGLDLRNQEDGIAAYGDARALARLRLHIAEAGGPLGMAFQVFFTDPHFFDYTVPAWPSGQLLFLDTAAAVPDEAGRQVLHPTPFVQASAFLDRDHARLEQVLGKRVLAPTPAMVLEVNMSHSLLETVDARQRHFHVRFNAAGNPWQDCPQGAGGIKTGALDQSGDIKFDRFAIDIADRRRAHVFLAKPVLPASEVSPPRQRLRAISRAGDKVPA